MSTTNINNSTPTFGDKPIVALPGWSGISRNQWKESPIGVYQETRV